MWPARDLKMAAGEQHDVLLRGITVQFPFVPYDCQRVYMEKVVECLQDVSVTHTHLRCRAVSACSVAARAIVRGTDILAPNRGLPVIQFLFHMHCAPKTHKHQNTSTDQIVDFGLDTC